jgi:hypothetical protein
LQRIVDQDDNQGAQQMYDEKFKLAWGSMRRRGDIICDCRYKHITIKEIKPTYYRVHHICNHIPQWLPFFIWWLAEKIDELIDNKQIGDYDILLEDGACCSLMNCCDDVTTHKESDHPAKQ